MMGLLANWRVLAAVGIAVGLAGTGWWIDSRAWQRGSDAATAMWQAREAVELREANAEILRLTVEVRRKEVQASEAISALDGRHQKEIAHVQAERKRFMDDLARGRVRFYAPAPARQYADRGAGPPPAAPAGRGDGEAPAGFSRALQVAVARGAELAAEADAVVVQLTLAQGVIESYLKACR